MAVRIPLSRGHVALVDDSDALFLLMFRWHSTGSNNGTTYAAGKVNGRVIRMHRLLLNPPAGMVVDHINGDGCDNRRSNIRICTPAQNTWNQKVKRGNTTGFKGVRRFHHMFDVSIQARGLSHRLGRFATAEDAARAYDAAASRLHGPFARLNFPNENGEPDCTPLAVTELTDLRILFPHSPLLAAVPQHKEQPT